METMKNIQELSEIKQRIELLEMNILKPELTDLRRIPSLYSQYHEIASEITDFYEKDSTEYRQVFLYCILMLYCPRAFAEQFLIRGLRRELAILFSLSPSNISNMIKDISFYYKMYTKFRNGCDCALSELNELK